MLPSDWYAPLLDRKTHKPLLETRGVEQEDVGMIVNIPPQRCEPSLRYVQGGTVQMNRVERMIAAGMDSDVADLLGRMRVGVAWDDIRESEVFVGAFGNTPRRATTPGARDGEHYYIGATAFRWTDDHAHVVASELLKLSPGPDTLEGRRYHVMGRDAILQTYNDYPDLFGDAVTLRMLSKVDDWSVVVMEEDVVASDEGAMRNAAMECVISCLSAVAGTGASILLAGIKRDPGAANARMIVVTLPIQEQNGEPQGIRSAKILRTVFSMASMGIVHASIAPHAVSGKYEKKVVVISHNRQHCVLMPDVTTDVLQFIMTACVLSDYVREKVMDLKQESFLVRRMQSMALVSENMLTNSSKYVMNEFERLWRDETGTDDPNDAAIDPLPTAPGLTPPTAPRVVVAPRVLVVPGLTPPPATPPPTAPGLTPPPATPPPTAPGPLPPPTTTGPPPPGPPPIPGVPPPPGAPPMPGASGRVPKVPGGKPPPKLVTTSIQVLGGNNANTATFWGGKLSSSSMFQAGTYESQIDFSFSMASKPAAKVPQAAPSAASRAPRSAPILISDDKSRNNANIEYGRVRIQIAQLGDEYIENPWNCIRYMIEHLHIKVFPVNGSIDDEVQKLASDTDFGLICDFVRKYTDPVQYIQPAETEAETEAEVESTQTLETWLGLVGGGGAEFVSQLDPLEKFVYRCYSFQGNNVPIFRWVKAISAVLNFIDERSTYQIRYERLTGAYEYISANSDFVDVLLILRQYMTYYKVGHGPNILPDILGMETSISRKASNGDTIADVFVRSNDMDQVAMTSAAVLAVLEEANGVNVVEMNASLVASSNEMSNAVSAIDFLCRLTDDTVNPAIAQYPWRDCLCSLVPQLTDDMNFMVQLPQALETVSNQAASVFGYGTSDERKTKFKDGAIPSTTKIFKHLKDAVKKHKQLNKRKSKAAAKGKQQVEAQASSSTSFPSADAAVDAAVRTANEAVRKEFEKKTRETIFEVGSFLRDLSGLPPVVTDQVNQMRLQHDQVDQMRLHLEEAETQKRNKDYDKASIAILLAVDIMKDIKFLQQNFAKQQVLESTIRQYDGIVQSDPEAKRVRDNIQEALDAATAAKGRGNMDSFNDALSRASGLELRLHEIKRAKEEKEARQKEKMQLDALAKTQNRTVSQEMMFAAKNRRRAQDSDDDSDSESDSGEPPPTAAGAAGPSTSSTTPAMQRQASSGSENNSGWSDDDEDNRSGAESRAHALQGQQAAEVIVQQVGRLDSSRFSALQNLMASRSQATAASTPAPTPGRLNIPLPTAPPQTQPTAPRPELAPPALTTAPRPPPPPPPPPPAMSRADFSMYAGQTPRWNRMNKRSGQLVVSPGASVGAYVGVTAPVDAEFYDVFCKNVHCRVVEAIKAVNKMDEVRGVPTALDAVMSIAAAALEP